ncbi:MAG: hypothetical protein BGO49_13410 [Planctomycetales bacterium 71-10]|nr:MAG: hypothetical protein BGO49_13410 [Planctomycetales bacterium 71-10]
MAEGLETRQVLSSYSTIPSATVSGTDADGDKWTLTLYGPGTMNVVDQQGDAFTKATAGTPDLINTITVAGTVTHSSRLVGTVTKGADGDGKVFFQNLNIQNNGAYDQIDPNWVQRRGTLAQNGIALVDMPDFWLGRTSTATPTATSDIHSSFKLAGGISAPEGINVLRFGGVDVNYTPTGGTYLPNSGQSNEFVVNLGLPISTGTSIIVDAVHTSAGTTTGSNNTTVVNQQSVTFLVTGRLNLFQANEITGATAANLIPTQFTPGATTPLAGGTYLVSQGGDVTGQIGYVRVGGDATNFTTFATASSIFTSGAGDTLDPKITNFMVGGETNNVMLIAPAGSRDVSFGRGMDNVVINSHVIDHLHANRGAVNSKVTVSRTLDNLKLGGDLVNSFIQSGYSQSLTSQAVSYSTGGGAFNGVAPRAIDNRTFNDFAGQSLPSAHGGGGINAQIAGSVVNSVVSVSVDPDPSGINDPGEFEQVTTKRFPFGAPQNIVLPRGYISAKIEGEIDNSGLQGSIVSADVPSDTAFFAKRVSVVKGAVLPPKVDTAPFSRKLNYSKAQDALKGLWHVNTGRNRG